MANSSPIMTDNEHNYHMRVYKEHTDPVLYWICDELDEPRHTHALSYYIQLAKRVLHRGIEVPAEIYEHLDLAIQHRTKCLLHHIAVETDDEGHLHFLNVLKEIEKVFSEPLLRPRSQSDSFLESINWRRSNSPPATKTPRDLFGSWRSRLRACSVGNHPENKKTSGCHTSANWRIRG